MVFYGEYSMNVTEGGRIALPKKIRDAVGGDVCVLTKGFDACLAGYGQQDWEGRSREFVARSLIDRTDMQLRRQLFSGASYMTLDDQGRCVIPENLMSYAKIQKRVIVAGIGDHFEIWSETLWNEYVS